MARTQAPLLDRAVVRSPWSAACDGAPDGKKLPVDPRSLVVEGVNSNPHAAVQYNAFYVDLHDPPAPYLKKLRPRPGTCGEFRASVEVGRQLIQRGQLFQDLLPAQEFNELWRKWGYPERPLDFDEQLGKRYGLAPSPIRNPYPLPGEDPGTKDGGSGQLPLGLMQSRDEAGRWTGTITLSCSICHDNRLGTADETEFSYGQGNTSLDFGLFAYDLMPSELAPLVPFTVSYGRGPTWALGGLTDLVTMLYDMDTLESSPSLTESLTDGNAPGFTKAPNWWNRAFRTRQFWDGALSSDNVRSEMAFVVASDNRSAAQKRAFAGDFEDVNNFFVSLSPPAFPKGVDEQLATAGAVLFHSLDLWASGANADIPRHTGNGSCASCHGVYSPRFAEDPNFVSDSRLKGVAGVVVPIKTIQTDPARYLVMKDERRRRSWNSSWWAYNDLNPSWKGYPPEDAFASEDRRAKRAAYANGGPPASPEGPNQWAEPIGYFAPPMYGVWAAGPYLHNGSIPDIWGILKPSDRPDVWRRALSPAGQFGSNQGFAFSLSSYDFSRLGWRHEAVSCNEQQWQDAAESCTSELSGDDWIYDGLTKTLAEYIRFGIVTPPPIDEARLSSRLVYNTHLYGMSNRGHEFTRSLTDEQRFAIIEYLKTL